MNKKKLIPELRFPEFEKDGEWEEIKLKQFGTFYRGLTYGADDTANKGLLVLRSGNIQNDTLVLDKDLVFVDKECPDDLKLLNGDIVICMSNGSKSLVGKNAEYKAEYDGNITVGAFCSIMRPKNKFTKYFLQTGSYQSFIALSIGGGNINNLKNSDLEEFKCSAPLKTNEQQKIASCLSSLDEVIEAHSQKLDLLKDHKKGLMQNLFPQDGEKVPKVRFKEFEKDGEWVEKTIEQVFSIFQGYAFSSGDTVASGIRWLKIADVGIQEMKNDTPSFLPVNFQEEHKRFLVKKGDYVLALTRPILSGNLKIAPIDQIYHNSLLNQRVGKLVTEHNSTFIYYLIQTSNMVKSINSNIAGNEPPNLSFQQISDIEVFIPSKEEQQKIASTLSSLDELITAQAEKIEQLKEHKKGLMQGLFPEIKS